MKLHKLTAVALAISSPLAFAEQMESTWELGVFTDYVKSSTNKENRLDWNQIESGKSLGIDLQKVIDDYWNIRFEAARTRYNVQNGNSKDYGNRTGIDAIYKLQDSDLYLFGGVKRFNNVKSYNAVNLGAGYNFKLNDNFTFYTEAAVYKDINYGFVDQSIKLGIKYVFGGKSMPAKMEKEQMETAPATNFMAEEPIIDTDKDGVADKNDQCDNTPTWAKVDANGCSIYEYKEFSVTLNVLFDNDSYHIKKDQISDIEDLAKFLGDYKEAKVEIEGHTSVVGDKTYNQKLSEKRAQMVKQVLVTKYNIDAERLSAIGYGETQLLEEGDTPEAHEANRRVVAKVDHVVKQVVRK